MPSAWEQGQRMLSVSTMKNNPKQLQRCYPAQRLHNLHLTLVVFRDHFVTSFGSVISSSPPWAKTNLSVWYSPHPNPNVLISSVLIHMLTHRAVLPAATFPESWGEKNGELRGGKVRQTWTGVVSLLQAHLLWMSCPVHDIFMEGEKKDKKVGHYFFFFFFFEPLNKPLNYIRPLSLYQA